jgi:hypothetical protein
MGHDGGRQSTAKSGNGEEFNTEGAESTEGRAENQKREEGRRKKEEE